MAKRVGVDKWLYGVTVLLVFIGLLMVFSASAVMAEDRYSSPYTFVSKQVGWAVLGLVTMTLLMRVDYRKFNRPIVVFPAVAVTTLLLLGVFLLRDSHNTHRWIRFGGIFQFQPSEIAKPVPAALPTLVFLVLIVSEPDLGTTLVCAAVAAMMFYLAGAETKYFGYAVLASIPVLYFLLFRVPWRRARMLAFLNPEADPQGSGFHTIQSLIAVGTGGIRGVGFFEGRAKLFYLPQPHTDFIFANIAEELGLIGAVAIVALFAALGYRGLRAASLSKDTFARFLAFGITATILIQAFFNISVVLALVPTKGITLPFVSYGGTSLFITMASIGVLLSLTREID
jgi:cell division protein FtsW